MNLQITAHLRAQDGVISRAQAIDAKLTDNDIRRLVRRREWAQLHPGVYINHTGPPTWKQRAWAAVLTCAPAALCHDSALRADDGPGRSGRKDSDPIHVAVDRDRAVRVPEGIVLHRVSDLTDKVRWNLSPPRVRAEEAVLDLAATASDDFAAIAVVADAIQARRTTSDRIIEAMARRRRIARRAFLHGVLLDVRDGACSALEHAYLTRVERPHGLPVANRQVRDSANGPIYRDVLYADLGLVVELDGRHFHDDAASRDLDLDRDLDAAVTGLETVRLGWGQAVRRPCATADRIAAILRRRGWTGRLTPCPDCERGASQSPDDCESPRSA